MLQAYQVCIERLWVLCSLLVLYFKIHFNFLKGFNLPTWNNKRRLKSRLVFLMVEHLLHVLHGGAVLVITHC